MKTLLHVLLTVVMPVIVYGAAGWYIWRRILSRRSDGSELAARLLITIASVTTMAVVGHFAGRAGTGLPGMVAAFIGLVVVLIGVSVLFALWIGPFIDLVARPLTAAFTGGSAEVDPAPFYGKVQGLRKRGEYEEARLELEAQLERFPGDLTGELLRAEMLAEDLGDLPGAFTRLHELRTQRDFPPPERARIWMLEAELQRVRLSNYDAARAALEHVRRDAAGTPMGDEAERVLRGLPVDPAAAEAEAAAEAATKKSLQVPQHPPSERLWGRM